MQPQVFFSLSQKKKKLCLIWTDKVLEQDYSCFEVWFVRCTLSGLHRRLWQVSVCAGLDLDHSSAHGKKPTDRINQQANLLAIKISLHLQIHLSRRGSYICSNIRLHHWSFPIVLLCKTATYGSRTKRHWIRFQGQTFPYQCNTYQ